ncbi:MAG: LD-carboxypeptidase [Pirellulales bacterium]|nr:LD-carboxypeptidase [Pirellulales bacterium]
MTRTSDSSRPERLVPPALRSGDTIGVFAPAGVVPRERLERALARISARGFRVKTYGDLFRERGYLAGDDDARAAELNAALADPETTAVMPARGGYGCARLVDRLDYAAVRRRPKLVAGFSDLTAIHAALAAQTGLATLHSPNLVDGWGGEEPPTEWVEESFWQAAGLVSGVFGELTAPPPQAAAGLATLRSGVAEGPLIGGNAAVFAGLTGSPYMPDFAGAILFLEDVGERPYRLDRMLAQMRLAGLLDKLAGVLLGQFTDCDEAPDNPSLALSEVWDDYFGSLGVPVLAGYPTGHVRDNATLPLGTSVRIDATNQTVQCVAADARG